MSNPTSGPAGAVRLFCRAIGVAVITATLGASAQEAYPARPITFVVPFPPASTTDVVARVVGQKMSILLGQPVVVDNKPGANGVIGQSYVAHAKADGYTLVLGSAATMTVGAALAKSLPYKVDKDFAPVSLFCVVAPLLVVNSSSKANTVADLVQQAKAAPGKLNYGAASPTSRLLGALFKSSTGTQMAEIGYKGPAQVVTDLIAGRIDISFEAPGAVMPFVRSGALKALAVMGTARSSALPAVPTVREAGFQALELEGFIGLLAPAGTPAAIIDKLAAAAADAVAAPEVAEQLKRLGMEPRSSSAADFASKVDGDFRRIEAVIQASGIERQ